MVEKTTSKLLILRIKLFRGDRLAQWYEASLFAQEEVGVQVQIPAGLLPVFFFSFFFLLSYFYPLACFPLFSLLILFSFARFLR